MESSDNNELRLCSTCQSFYGTANTNFLCSKCFKDQKATAQEPTNEVVVSAPVQAAVEVNADQASIQLPSQSQQPEPELQEESKEPVVDPAEPVPVAVAADVEMKAEEPKEEQVEEKKVQVNLNKCWECNRKVGLVQTPCRCGYVYCPKHRHSEQHNCSFDFHQLQKDKLAKDNPMIAHQKMEKMF